MRVDEFVTFIKAREDARLAKEYNVKPKLYDEIIAKYRFCNVRRNDDRVTRWIHEYWLHPCRDDPHVWFAMIVARLFNHTNTLANIGYQSPFKPEAVRKILHKRVLEGKRIFNPAYIVSTNGRPKNKIDYVIQDVLQPIWTLRNNVKLSLRGCTLSEMHDTFVNLNGLGSFMAAQVVADLKYIEPWRSAPDFDTFASSGPGSRRGLNRVMAGEVSKSYPEGLWRLHLDKLRTATNKKLRWQEPLTAHDIQNCLCEFDKYERVRLGEGRPKQYYQPFDGDMEI